MAGRRKPFLDNFAAVTLKIYADKAKEAHENWLRATTELSRLEEISGVAAKRQEVNRYHLDERSAFLAMQRIIAREVPDVSKDDE